MNVLNRHLVLVAVVLYTFSTLLNCECRSQFFSTYDGDRGPAWSRAVRKAIIATKRAGKGFAETVENEQKFIGTYAYVIILCLMYT